MYAGSLPIAPSPAPKLMLRRHHAAATGFKDASRALYPLWHEVDQDKKKKVTFAELQEALPAIMSVPWTHITQRLVENKVHKLDSLNAKERAALLFLRVYNIGEARAQTFVAAGARTLEDLERLGEQKKISWTKGHKIGLKHLDVSFSRAWTLSSRR